MRISEGAAFAPLLLLAGCDAELRNKVAEAQANASQTAAAGAEGNILCVPPGYQLLERICPLDRTETQDGLYLTIRHPDGGFRRLLVTRDGRGVIAADGAEEAKVALVGTNEIEVEIGDARYRLPATVRSAKAR